MVARATVKLGAQVVTLGENLLGFVAASVFGSSHAEHGGLIDSRSETGWRSGSLTRTVLKGPNIPVPARWPGDSGRVVT